jgi:protein-disulfide isomerase
MKRLLLFCIVLISCEGSSTSKKVSLSGGQAGCSGDTAASSGGPLFELDGNTYSREDLPPKMAQQIYENNLEAYQKNQTIIKEFALRTFLAKKKGKPTEAGELPQLTELIDSKEPSDKEIKDLFEQSKDRLPPGTKLEAPLKAQISNYLKGQKMGGLFRKEVQKMEKSGDFRSLVAGPEAPEMKFDLEAYPSKGDKNSKVSVVEVSDYTCGHCQRAHGKVQKFMKDYSDKVKFTQINFALRPNGLSGLYIQGAYCAQKQDKFWTYHDNAFEKASEPHDHAGHHHGHSHSADENKGKVMEVAKKSKLDMKKFETCLNSDEAKSYVTTTSSKLSEKGVTGTPMFLVNGKKVATGIEGLEEEVEKLL